MPRRDRTGPMGWGPRTGRGLGPCGYGRVSPRRRYSRRGFGGGQGFGFRGRPGGRPFGGGYGLYPEVDDRELLKEQRDLLREELAILEDYLKED